MDRFSNLPRKFEVILTKLRIDYTQISHCHVMNKNDAPICPTCGTQLTIKHMMTEYREYSDSRITTKLPEELSESLGQNLSSLTATINLIRYIK